MKATAAVTGLLVLAFFGFSYFHSKSIDRARLLNSKSDLLYAQKQLRENGAITNASRHTQIESLRTQLSVDGVDFVSELVGHLPGYTNAGHLLLTTNGVFIWMDKASGPIIVGGAGYPHVTPRRFRDF